MTMGRGYSKIVASFLAFLLLAGVSSGGFKYVDAIDLDISEFSFYNNTAKQFVLSTLLGGSEVPIDVGNISVFGGGWDYTFVGRMVVTASDLAADLSSGGRAMAVFSNGSSAGPATMTIIATTLTDKISGIDIISPTTHPGGVVLLTARMNSEDDEWYVWETGKYTDAFIGDTHYEITGGELKDGSLLRLSDFRATWALGQCGPANITGFNQNLNSYLPSLEIMPDVPEPATILLFGAGVFAFKRR
ncbi:MAG TPA: PEP-CTERM sorting domain-containing protein [Anaerohalosphaeraceae bacterium]|nr:PEP-CTERM sorting domain-containing protein [Anaerohalosphaeraceae bacterium]